MTLATGNLIGKLKYEWTAGDYQVVKPYQLQEGEMGHIWVVKSIVWENGGKHLRVEMDEVE